MTALATPGVSSRVTSFAISSDAGAVFGSTRTTLVTAETVRGKARCSDDPMRTPAMAIRTHSRHRRRIAARRIRRLMVALM